MSSLSYSKHQRHNRYLSYSAEKSANKAYLAQATKPTSKQVAFYNVLYAKCKQNNLKAYRHNGCRASYTLAIGRMLKELETAGIH